MPVTIRPYRAEDESELLAVWSATLMRDPITPIIWRRSFLLDPSFRADDCPVAIDQHGNMVGFALGMTQRGEGESPNPRGVGVIVAIGVVESQRRSGTGRALVAHLLESWRSEGVGSIRVGPWVPTYLTPGIDTEAYPAAIPFFTAIGGASGEQAISMKASLTERTAPDALPAVRERLTSENVMVRAATSGDTVPLLTFTERAFPEWIGYARASLAAIAAGESSEVTLHIATDQGEVIGFAQSERERFGPFGVDPEYRGRGVGGVLLAATLDAMRARGFHVAWFLWTSDRVARLYAGHGFEVARRFTMMSIDLSEEGYGTRIRETRSSST